MTFAQTDGHQRVAIIAGSLARIEEIVASLSLVYLAIAATLGGLTFILVAHIILCYAPISCRRIRREVAGGIHHATIAAGAINLVACVQSATVAIDRRRPGVPQLDGAQECQGCQDCANRDFGGNSSHGRSPLEQVDTSPDLQASPLVD